MPILNVQTELEFVRPQLGDTLMRLEGDFTNWVQWTLPAAHSSPVADERYLGNWSTLFTYVSNAPFPSQEAINWISKDHAEDTRPPQRDLALIDRLDSHKRTEEPPYLVASHPDFCSCPRRYRWRTDAELDSVWYNWPKILGKYETVKGCIEAYTRFQVLHRKHKDSIYFRAAIFAAVLGKWCQAFQMKVDYRGGAAFSTDIAIFVKIEYYLAKPIRMLEFMALTQFLHGAHNVLIGDASVVFETRRGPVLTFQRT